MYGLKSGKTFTFVDLNGVKVFSGWTEQYTKIYDLTQYSMSGGNTYDGYITGSITNPMEPKFFPDGTDVTREAPLMVYVAGEGYNLKWDGSKIVATKAVS